MGRGGSFRKMWGIKTLKIQRNKGVMENPVFVLEGKTCLTHSHTVTPFDTPGKQAF